ncbi:FHA domain-containing protein [Streptomyces flaveolus]|uniref:FHA domain-containing protein n=1 Tax=Streptomyces flaveolus TaxID=67297 RepID=UPI00166FFB05|nr:FHA domain-containing protein [Streptomyces flaveolus]
MQIRLTVVDPLGPHLSTGGSAPAASCDVLVTAPAGTALAAVASALASVVPGSDGQGSGQVVLYAGAQRLDAQRSTLGEPPLIDGAVLCLGAPGEPDPHTEPAEVPAQLHVVAGPDAGGVHLLHGGQIRLGRSADADVALDDPDVSRMHCAVTVAADGRVSVADLGSTNGTTLDGTRVGERPVRFAPGALLRIGESALRLVPAARGAAIRVATTPDGEGYVRLPGAVTDGDQVAHGRVGDGADIPAERTHHAHGTAAYGAVAAPAGPPLVPGQGAAPRIESHGTGFPGDAPRSLPGAGGPRSGAAGVNDTHAGAPGAGSAPAGATGAGWGYAGVADAGGPGRAGAADARGAGRTGASGTDRGHEEAYGTDRGGEGRAHGAGSAEAGASGTGARVSGMGGRLAAEGPTAGADPAGAGRKGTPLRGTDVPQGVRRRGGLGAWARRLTGGRGVQDAAGPDAYVYDEEAAGPARTAPPAGACPVPETWPDSASLLLTALGPGPRLWERGPGHPEVLAVRLGTADRMAPGSDAPLPAVPVTVGLREAGALGLAGPRARLTGLARAVLAQLAALHSPDLLEIVLISADRSRPLAERTAEWSWLGWLPQVRPGHGQDCRLLLAYDRDQAMARAQELLRRLEDHLTDARSGARPPAPAGTIPAQPTAPVQDLRHGGPDASDPPGGSGAVTGSARRPSWARADDGSDPADGFAGPYTVVVVDGDPGGADVREVMARLALEGPRAGIHVVCLAETAAASPTSPVMQTYEAACAASPVFRDCGAVALLSGDVATTLRLLRVARSGSSPSGPVGHGTVGTVDAVSPAWAERFARALAPLRTDGAGGERHARVSAPLPQAARLLDELGLARATPASLMARWADAADDAEALGGRAHAVLGAGPRGPVAVDLAAEGPHLLIEGPPGSGRTELLRALVASLASAERPDRLGIVLMDGRDNVGAGNGHGEGLRVCTDVPHVTTHLTANDPVRMREFAQSLSAELKRRAELLGRSDFAEWHTGREVSGRMVSQRTPAGGAGTMPETGDVESPPSSTLRLRPGAARRRAGAVPPLPRLVVVVDDLDALVTPPLGSPGRPAAGSVMRALEAVAREGERLGVHLVAAAGPGGRTAQTEPARRASLRAVLDAPAAGPDEPLPGRGRLDWADGRSVPFQAGRVTGRIPRTATLRPTVVALEWHRMGDPPARRPVRELGNGPTDLALLASALERAAREVSAAEVPSLL